jgi:hypothetical protein
LVQIDQQNQGNDDNIEPNINLASFNNMVHNNNSGRSSMFKPSPMVINGGLFEMKEKNMKSLGSTLENMSKARKHEGTSSARSNETFDIKHENKYMNQGAKTF